MNRRVARLIDTAKRYSLPVEESQHTAGCWIIRLPYGHSLTVYATGKNGATVYADLAGSSEWSLITQRRAFTIMCEEGTYR